MKNVKPQYDDSLTRGITPKQIAVRVSKSIWKLDLYGKVIESCNAVLGLIPHILTTSTQNKCIKHSPVEV